MGIRCCVGAALVAARGPQTPHVVWVSGGGHTSAFTRVCDALWPALRIRRMYSSQTTLSADMRSGSIVAFQYFSPQRNVTLSTRRAQAETLHLTGLFSSKQSSLSSNWRYF